MLGALFGDIVGSVFEWRNTHDYDFVLLSEKSRPTDDSYMTLAVAKALMDSEGAEDTQTAANLISEMQRIGRKYPHAGYGGMFSKWLYEKNPKPYQSYGNGSAMRVSSVGWLYPTLEETCHMAKVSAAVSHDHPEGIKGAEAIASCIYLARMKHSKEEIKAYIVDTFGYDLSRRLDEIRVGYGFYATCPKSVPEAITAFLESEDYEDAIRKAITLGGDSDTIACMAGGIAQAYYGMPEAFQEKAMAYFDGEMQAIIQRFLTTVSKEK